MTYVFDIDGTICSAGHNNYAAATPYKDRIERVNKLYDEGHTIVFLTARDMGRSNNSIEYAYAAFETKTMQQPDPEALNAYMEKEKTDSLYSIGQLR